MGKSKVPRHIKLVDSRMKKDTKKTKALAKAKKNGRKAKWSRWSTL